MVEDSGSAERQCGKKAEETAATEKSIFGNGSDRLQIMAALRMWQVRWR